MFVKYYKIIDLSLLVIVAVLLILMITNMVGKNLFDIFLYISILLFIIKIVLRIIVKKSLNTTKEDGIRKDILQ